MPAMKEQFGSDVNGHYAPDSFVLYRILGNDLPPRHRSGQTLANLEFTLTRELPFTGLEKRWLLNRIVNPHIEAAIMAMLDRYGQHYDRLCFNEREYRAVRYRVEGFPHPDYLYRKAFNELEPGAQCRAEDTVYQDKNRYLMNNNGARNAALQAGRERARWVLPWDGNCFLTEDGWGQTRAAVLAQPDIRYHVVPMTRVRNNALLLQPGFVPDPVEEPQLIFRCDASEEFDEDLRYGRRPKVDFFWRLGVGGPWDRWGLDPWEVRPSPAPEFGRFARGGWVARLFSGVEELEQHTPLARKNRGTARQIAVRNFIDELDCKLARQTLGIDRLIFIDEEALDLQLSAQNNLVGETLNLLTTHAEGGLKASLYSVTSKASVAPSGNIHDYWNPAPYWWPNSDTADGLPYVRRDGHRVPGTDLNGAGSENYDRTSLQNMFDETFTMALAWRCTGDTHFAAQAAKLLRTWFNDAKTRMTPHMKFSQVQMGRNGNEGAGFGIIEFKDVNYFLDAVRLIDRAGALTETDREEFSQWLDSYLVWLLTSVQGRAEHSRQNNHATFYDLQVASIATYLGKTEIVLNRLMYSQQRILQQFSPDGAQPLEMKRPDSAHYCLFNLQGWFDLATLARAHGIDLWNYETSDGRSLRKGFEWLVQSEVSFSGERTFDGLRLVPLKLRAARALGVAPPSTTDIANTPFSLHPFHGVRPYWYLGPSW
jgi:hypothetical protein